MPQLNLNFTDIPIPETCLWEQLDDALIREHRGLILRRGAIDGDKSIAR